MLICSTWHHKLSLLKLTNYPYEEYFNWSVKDSRGSGQEVNRGEVVLDCTAIYLRWNSIGPPASKLGFVYFVFLKQDVVS
ncbi:hypothetical protein PanWU01x14_009470 [Parasponia andersonii]|uniref:Uncharacterized protein n=1 Tax=Parasponia andersonii TaxID=3476 RepID=A0A2P5E2E5_PARAD|nr:hypothetical protein PanWU01x14_009470 [Parasponia andersonii]